MKARQKILKEANKVSWSKLTMRHIHLAVKICRHHKLISDKVLIDAGFNPN